MNLAHCLLIVMIIGKDTDVFRGIFSGGGRVGEGVSYEDLFMEECIIGVCLTLPHSSTF